MFVAEGGDAVVVSIWPPYCGTARSMRLPVWSRFIDVDTSGRIVRASATRGDRSSNCLPDDEPNESLIPRSLHGHLFVNGGFSVAETENLQRRFLLGQAREAQH